MFNMGGMAMPSVADIAAVTGAGRNNNSGWGDGNGWWVLIILFAIFGGWGNNGMNNGNGNCCCNGGSGSTVSLDASLQRGFDNQSVINKLGTIQTGLSSLGYDQLAQMNGINTNILQTGFGITQAINNSDVNAMQNMNALQAQIAACCCENRAGQAQIQYEMASNVCDLKTLINQVAQQIQWGQQNGLRDLTELINQQFCNLRMEQKDAIISELQLRLNNCDRDTALQSLGNYVVNQLSPRAVPCYPSANPNGFGNWSPDVLAGGQFVGGNCCNRCS